MFTITQRQYELIMHQAQENFPYETGGILCGSPDGIIKGVMPLYNLAEGDQHRQFGITADDIRRGYDFAEKHGLVYFGVYHTHPQGAAYPSKEDLEHNQRHLFIISLRDRYNPELAAFSVSPTRIPTQEEINVINNNGVTVIDIHTGKPKLSDNVTAEEMSKLNLMIENIIEEKQKYPKLQPKNKFEAYRSSFNTEA